jgi:hypothetical protein
MMGLLRAVAETQNLILKIQGKIMTKADEMNAKIDALEATVQDQKTALEEQGAAILKEIEQLKAAGTGGSGDGMSAGEVDAAAARLEAVRGLVGAGTETVRTSTGSLKADD